MSPDIVIVGGGLAGLTAATELTRRGAAVTVYEGAGNLGGRARTTSVDGYQLNLGPHALFPAGPAWATFRRFGLDLSGGLVPDDVYRFVTAGTLTPAFGPGSPLQSGPDRESPFDRLMREAAALPPDVLSRTSLRDLLREALDSDSAAAVAAMARAATYAAADDVLSADAAVAQLQSAGTGGSFYLDGGWQRLVDGLTEQAVRGGARISRGTPVVRVGLARGGHVQVETTAGTADTGGVVLATGGPRRLTGLLSGGPQALVTRAMARARPSRLAVLDLALHRLPDPDAAVVFGVDQPLYLSTHSQWARLAPPDGAVIHAAHYLRPGERGGQQHRHRIEALLDLAQPGWRDVVIDQRWMPQLVVTSALPASSDGGLPGRLPVALAPRIAVAGDWVGAVGLLADAAVASALAATDHVMTGSPTRTSRPASPQEGPSIEPVDSIGA